ncbi:aldo/keto reductase [Vibrio cholerae]|uniref:aldo/keto reductase n=3 Tax=Vibrio cholerae TaxID=666 RepID=UPI000E0C9279|nr:aldo/keto reductase [Vibrio cholerae]USN27096.1 aldo/keto reductase [synthetic construct]EGQ8410017.1 hypothetical protein [Vibrio cholerae]EGQ8412195.1 hypothetical protein [Vibrio cholerae]EJL6308980.1 aldo/keto reductase [Vibrio cholerae]EKF9287177.1 aldo/keto reductase [Vibrio cholerae]
MNKGNLDFNVGLGTWGLQGEKLSNIVFMALRMGYTHIDTAQAYNNIYNIYNGYQSSGIHRKNLHITYKIEPSILSNARFDLKNEIKSSGFDHFDNLTLHYPSSKKELYICYKKLEHYKCEEQIGSWGVSNFSYYDILDCLNEGFLPQSNQIEMHPFHFQNELYQLCKENNITPISYRPLGKGKFLNHKLLLDISQKYQLSPSEVILYWLFSRGYSCYVKASSYHHLLKNFNSHSRVIDENSLKLIDNLNSNISFCSWKKHAQLFK